MADMADGIRRTWQTGQADMADMADGTGGHV